MTDWAFDPRVGDAVLTGNPSLLAARVAATYGIPVDWHSVAEWADYCDETVNVEGMQL